MKCFFNTKITKGGSGLKQFRRNQSMDLYSGGDWWGGGRRPLIFRGLSNAKIWKWDWKCKIRPPFDHSTLEHDVQGFLRLTKWWNHFSFPTCSDQVKCDLKKFLEEGRTGANEQWRGIVWLTSNRNGGFFGIQKSQMMSHLTRGQSSKL